ncbi:MAG TPA: DUF2786 domain-containing protein [Pyrinomonadaceae bacterium]
MNKRIIDKIRKLIRHEQSASSCSTPEEAAAFAAKIQQLCIAHKISVDQVRVDDEAEHERVGEERVRAGSYSVRFGRGYVPLEDNRLMCVVAEAHFCQAIGLPGTNTILLVGEEWDRVVAVEMFRFLSSTMKRLARLEEEKTRRARRSVRRFKSYFYLGFTSAVRRRYQEMRTKADGETTALVRADALVKRYVANNYETVPVKPRKLPRVNKNGYFAGVVAGSNVDLNSTVLGENDASKQIGVL